MSSMTEAQSKNSDSLAISGENVSPSKGDSDQSGIRGGHHGTQKAESDKAIGSKGKYCHS